MGRATELTNLALVNPTGQADHLWAKAACTTSQVLDA